MTVMCVLGVLGFLEATLNGERLFDGHRVNADQIEKKISKCAYARNRAGRLHQVSRQGRVYSTR